MPRRAPRRTIKSYNRDKYSKENRRVTIATAIEQVAGTGLYQGGQTIVAPTDVQGMRKVKHITVTLSKLLQSGSTDDAKPFYWALVFVPQGYLANTLGGPTGSLYEPNQYVMACGCIDPDAGPIRIRSPISRNLNSGDSISLVIGSPTGPQVSYVGVVSYAVTLQ